MAFRTATDFCHWLEKNHATAAECVVVLPRKDSGRKGVTYAEALDAALCFGWIDGVRKNRDAGTYTIRFSPRKAGSIWSRVNVAHAQRLIREGRMQPAGAKAFAARTARRTGVYSFENKPSALPSELERQFEANPAAWTFFSAQPPGYRRTLQWWIMSAKQEPTRLRRLAQLIAESAAQRRVNLLSPYGRGEPPPRPRKN